MIVVLTVFKYVEGAPIPAQKESEALEAALQEEMIDTGDILWFHSRLKFFGTEVGGVRWDDAALYAVRDAEAMRRWMLWDKHRAVDAAMAENNALVSVLPLQFTDAEDTEAAMNEFLAVMREGAFDRAEHGLTLDFPAARFGPDYAMPELADLAAGTDRK
ncbi:hypothetical protein [Tsukamurella pseudospumae]|uniref:Uncharacterized protein n=1 Tax=Tsukamurella pseudospumae TaxID=239498 RepID=A0A137ZXS6_9ACTN|nr:hypothetical protein [Tsukamurella pseudospumae]KXO98336.1 hypothetical protein AXK61_20155 [Tsukamurella pseudospumae]KXP02980.1 hypothetical protein AXK60_13940 [Tsukamurella pseudospumae]